MSEDIKQQSEAQLVQSTDTIVAPIPTAAQTPGPTTTANDTPVSLKEPTETCTVVSATPTRENWSNKLDFLLSCVGYAVGLGNVWRFPYLCYSNGGVTFLIPYILMLAVCGLPLFFMELAFGQYSSLGAITIWKVCPLAKGSGIWSIQDYRTEITSATNDLNQVVGFGCTGMGYCFMIMQLAVSTSYNMILAYTVFYFFASFTSQLPWSTCDFNSSWTTPLCYDRAGNETWNVSAITILRRLQQRQMATVTTRSPTPAPRTTTAFPALSAFF